VAAVVGNPPKKMLSFIARGIPKSPEACFPFPARSLASSSRARESAIPLRPANRVMNALSLLLYRSTFSSSSPTLRSQVVVPFLRASWYAENSDSRDAAFVADEPPLGY
jgi:hypothetical protein